MLISNDGKPIVRTFYLLYFICYGWISLFYVSYLYSFLYGMVIIQKEVIEFDNDWVMWAPKYSLLVSGNAYVDIARDIAKDYPEWMLFNDLWEISWGYMKCEGYNIELWEAMEYERCEVETVFRETTYRWKEYNVESDYLFFNLFE